MSEQIKRLFYYILIFFIGVFITSSFLLRAEFNYMLYGDKPLLLKQTLWLYIPLMLMLLLLSLLLYHFLAQLNRLRERQLIPVILLLSFMIQLLIIIYLPVLPTADSKKVISIAARMLNEADYSSFRRGGYLFKFPHNFALVLYFKAVLSMFPGNLFVIKIFNIFFTTITTLLIYMIYKKLNTRAGNSEYGLLVFAAFYVPALFMCNYIYNDIISTTFFTGFLYFLISFVKDRRIAKLLIASLLLSAGNYFRNIGAIFLIAASLYLLLHLKVLGIKKVTASLVLMLLLFFAPGWIQNTVLQATHKVEASIYENSAPVHLWLNMGINNKYFGFFDHKQSYRIYEKDAKYDKERSKELFKEEIGRKLKETSAEEMIFMYYKKIIWTWTEGTYQIDRYGLGVYPEEEKTGKTHIMGGYSYRTSITELFNRDNRYREPFLWILYTMNTLIYCFIGLRLLYCLSRGSFKEVLLVIVLLGFIGFYLLWEIKSRYLYPIYPILLILSYQGYVNAYDYISCRVKKQHR